MNREPISRVPITSNTQPDFASCVNSCRNVASCVGTSYVVTTSLCTYFSTFTSVGADTGTNVAFPANIACPNLNGFSYLDYSGLEYGILCNQSYPASSNITTQSGYTSLATCSNACSYSANCLASSFVNGQCTFVSNLNSNTSPGQNLPGAVVLVLLQSRVVDVISSTGSTSRSTSFSVVQGLPTAAAAVQKGSNPYNAVASAWVGGIEVLDCLHVDDHNNHHYSIACSNIELVGLQTYFYSCAIELVISLVKLIILEFADIEIIVSSFTGKQFLGFYQRRTQSTYYELRFDQ
ncbi:hypothetical protein D6D19_10016 [Aureobasidium pullulans]|uniref:Apple domain-containing protein n=1 Tax=Aureobasidium pullulans TaxID=5580 RepID=A0A4S8Z8M6_AURPU|nr:hypothetical protein D6D19_10016 [Aureobasidium pullulans]